MGRSACLKVGTALSARPFVAGWYGTDVIWRMPLDLTNAWNSSETNCTPLSLMICSGIPNLANKSLRWSNLKWWNYPKSLPATCCVHRQPLLYPVIETSQEQCISLESRSGHGMNSLFWVENGSEGLVVVMSVNRLP